MIAQNKLVPERTQPTLLLTDFLHPCQLHVMYNGQVPKNGKK